MGKLLSFVTVLALAGCSAAPAPPPEATPPVVRVSAPEVPADAAIIVAFGDSLTAGLGLAPEDNYPSLLQNSLLEQGFPYRVINEGVSGDTSASALARVDTAASEHAELALIAIGANDGLRGLPIDEMEKNLREIVKRFAAAGSQVALAGMRIPPNMGPEYVQDFEAVFPRVAQDMEIPLLPFLLEGVAADPNLNQDDGIHPNEEGARMVAKLVADFVKPLLRRREKKAETE
ncbi:MAG: arylesterase [Acidobacteria bacterium]|nr:arylesterase [Acidobacteriota bacterium]MDA1233384.1 arylesterase [Acidobacteriota bacterium]